MSFIRADSPATFSGDWLTQDIPRLLGWVWPGIGGGRVEKSPAGSYWVGSLSGVSTVPLWQLGDTPVPVWHMVELPVRHSERRCLPVLLSPGLDKDKEKWPLPEKLQQLDEHFKDCETVEVKATNCWRKWPQNSGPTRARTSSLRWSQRRTRQTMVWNKKALEMDQGQCQQQSARIGPKPLKTGRRIHRSTLSDW